jgi:hypothetical protein
MTETKLDSAAVLLKYPSANKQRTGSSPYTVIEGTLNQCVRKLTSYAVDTRHLYEIQVTMTPGGAPMTIPYDQIVELARFKDFI